MTSIGRDRYAALYGPTVGDRIRLADTDLLIEVTEDRCGPGDEAVFGGREDHPRIHGPVGGHAGVGHAGPGHHRTP